MKTTIRVESTTRDRMSDFTSEVVMQVEFLRIKTFVVTHRQMVLSDKEPEMTVFRQIEGGWEAVRIRREGEAEEKAWGHAYLMNLMNLVCAARGIGVMQAELAR